MFGTVARMKIKQGKEQELQALSEEWRQERGAAVGAVAEYVYKLEGRPNEYIMAVLFKDRESYYANANDPEQDRWYRRLRGLLEADPEWNDGEVVQALEFQKT